MLRPLYTNYEPSGIEEDVRKQATGPTEPSLCDVFSNMDLAHQQRLVRHLGQRTAVRLRVVCRQARDVVDSCMPEAYLMLTDPPKSVAAHALNGTSTSLSWAHTTWPNAVASLLRQLSGWPHCGSITVDSTKGGGPLSEGDQFLAPFVLAAVESRARVRQAITAGRDPVASGAPANAAPGFSRFPQVTSLTLLVTRGNMLDPGPPASLTLAAASALSYLFPNLQCLALRGSWHASQTGPVYDFYNAFLPATLPHLRALELPGLLFHDRGVRLLTALEHLTLGGLNVHSIPGRGLSPLTRLRSLTIRVHGPVLPSLMQLASLTPSIERLHAIALSPVQDEPGELLVDLPAGLLELRQLLGCTSLAALAALLSDLGLQAAAMMRDLRVSAVLLDSVTLSEEPVAAWIARRQPGVLADKVILEPSCDPVVAAVVLGGLLRTRRELVLRWGTSSWMRPQHDMLHMVRELGVSVPVERLAGLHLHLAEPQGGSRTVAWTAEALSGALEPWPALGSVTVALSWRSSIDRGTVGFLQRVLSVGLDKLAPMDCQLLLGRSSGWRHGGNGGSWGANGSRGEKGCASMHSEGWCAVVTPGVSWSDAAMDEVRAGFPGCYAVQLQFNGTCKALGRMGCCVVVVGANEVGALDAAKQLLTTYEEKFG